MLRARKTQERVHYLLGLKEGDLVYEFPLDKKKILIGRASHADISIQENAVSHYHAFITIDEHGGKIIDLDSDNGVFLNGKRCKESFFSDGDILKLGPLEFQIEERIIEVAGKVTIEDQDAGIIEVISQHNIIEALPELPPLPGLVVIDGEYCDIVFNDSSYICRDKIEATEGKFNFTNYVDSHEVDKNLIIPIARRLEESAVEVTVLLNGNVLTMDYFPIKNKTYYASPVARNKNTVSLPCLEDNDRVPLITIKNSNITLNKLSGLKARMRNNCQEDLFKHRDCVPLENDDVVYYENNTTQVIVKITKAPPYLRSAPFFGRDRAFQKESAKIFGLLMSLMLLLLFIDTKTEPPKKKIAVIYRKAIKSKRPSDKKSKSIADKVNKDTGVKQSKQPNNDTKMAKKSVDKVVKKKQKMMKQTQKKITKSASNPQKVNPTPKPKVKKIKAYNFKANQKLSSLFKTNKNLKPTKLKVPSQSSNLTGFKSVSQISDSSLKATENSAVGTLGKDLSGNNSQSSGPQGLSSKSGIDTTYQDPKTVVLGSMDPELLRKILKEYLPQFRHCYQKELENNEAAKGVIDLQFRINGNGSVSKINILSKKAKFSRAGSGCMANVLKLIDFPRPKGGGVVDVKQPLNFFSEQDKY